MIPTNNKRYDDHEAKKFINILPKFLSVCHQLLLDSQEHLHHFRNDYGPQRSHVIRRHSQQ